LIALVPEGVHDSGRKAGERAFPDENASFLDLEGERSFKHEERIAESLVTMERRSAPAGGKPVLDH
jgi:hypothetical protein